MAWRWHYDSHEEAASLIKRDAAYLGTHLPGDAGEWTSCDWDPQAVFLPKLVAGATAVIRSSCPFGDGSRDHIEGEVRVLGRRTVRFEGAPHEVWVVERRWRHWRDSGGAVATFEATSLWSPQLEMVIDHNCRSRVDFGSAMAGQEVNSSFRLLGVDGGTSEPR